MECHEEKSGGGGGGSLLFALDWFATGDCVKTSASNRFAWTGCSGEVEPGKYFLDSIFTHL